MCKAVSVWMYCPKPLITLNPYSARRVVANCRILAALPGLRCASRARNVALPGGKEETKRETDQEQLPEESHSKISFLSGRGK